MATDVGPQAQLPLPFSAVSFTWWMYGTGSLTAAGPGLVVTPTYFVAATLPVSRRTLTRCVLGASESTTIELSSDQVSASILSRDVANAWRLPDISTVQ